MGLNELRRSHLNCARSKLSKALFSIFTFLLRIDLHFTKLFHLIKGFLSDNLDLLGEFLSPARDLRSLGLIKFFILGRKEEVLKSNF